MENIMDCLNQATENIVVVVEKDSGTLYNCPWQVKHQQRKVLEELFNPILRFTTLFGGHLPCKSANPWRYRCHLLFIFTIVGLALYQLGYLIFYIANSADYNVTTASTLVILTWHFQALLSVFFLIYWQEKGYFCRIFRKIHLPNGSEGCKRTKRCIRFVFRIVVGLTVTIFVMIILEMTLVMLGSSNYVVNIEAYNAYGTHKLVPFAAFIALYTFIFWTIAILIYITMTTAVQGELCYFNDQLRKLGDEEAQEKVKDIGSELLGFYRKHCELSEVVRELDNTFEVYTFAMLGSNIPTTIFSLLALFVSLQTTWWNVLFALPSVVFCFMSMIGLTAVPARLHSTVSEVEKILYSLKCIWVPYSEKNYQIAHLFISHVNQTNLGISVWGFAIVTKPLILTTISLTITYLSFFMQMRSSCGDSSCNAMNATLT